MGEYWTLRGGDFRLPGRLLEVPFNNLYYPEITGRGVSIEASHGGRTFGFLFGAETLQAGVRGSPLLQAPQTMGGADFPPKVGARPPLGARALPLSDDLSAIRQTPYLA